ncbi:MAG: LamG-like jellyroll fold domain-containing protein [Verrucomicrobiales bacterium]
MSDYTMSAWVNWSQTNGAGDQFIFGQTGGNGLHDGIRGSNWHMGHWGQDLAAGGANAPLADGNWQHVTFRYQDGVSQILVNGVLAASGTRGGFQPNNPFIIGTRQNSVNHDFQGVLDEVAIYPTALADFQVQLLANGHNAIIPEPTRAFTLLAGLGAMLIRRRR